MIGLLQRVARAHVEVDSGIIAAIEQGLLVLVGVERGDGQAQADRLLQRLLSYRVFPDESGRMNLSLNDTGGGLLLVPQFTLAADTQKGPRASFSPAAEPELGRQLFKHLLGKALMRHANTASGIFGAHMQIGLVNDGPVTFLLQAR
ncbi:MAG: D-aminoacyl-tRNA deacylase [Mariprofundaceae bacterium]